MSIELRAINLLRQPTLAHAIVAHLVKHCGHHAREVSVYLPFCGIAGSNASIARRMRDLFQRATASAFVLPERGNGLRQALVCPLEDGQKDRESEKACPGCGDNHH